MSWVVLFGEDRAEDGVRIVRPVAVVVPSGRASAESAIYRLTLTPLLGEWTFFFVVQYGTNLARINCKLVAIIIALSEEMQFHHVVLRNK